MDTVCVVQSSNVERPTLRSVTLEWFYNCEHTVYELDNFICFLFFSLT